MLLMWREPGSLNYHYQINNRRNQVSNFIELKLVFNVYLTEVLKNRTNTINYYYNIDY